jgi:hypothetical protein
MFHQGTSRLPFGKVFLAWSDSRLSSGDVALVWYDGCVPDEEDRGC